MKELRVPTLDGRIAISSLLFSVSSASCHVLGFNDSSDLAGTRRGHPAPPTKELLRLGKYRRAADTRASRRSFGRDQSNWMGIWYTSRVAASCSLLV